MEWQEHQPAHGQRMKRDTSRIKEKKAHSQAIPSSKKKRDAENEDPRTHSHYKS